MKVVDTLYHSTGEALSYINLCDIISPPPPHPPSQCMHASLASSKITDCIHSRLVWRYYGRLLTQFHPSSPPCVSLLQPRRQLLVHSPDRPRASSLLPSPHHPPRAAPPLPSPGRTHRSHAGFRPPVLNTDSGFHDRNGVCC